MKSKSKSSSPLSIALPEFNLSQSTSQVIYKRIQTALVVLTISIVTNLALRVDFMFFNDLPSELSITEMLQQLLLLGCVLSFIHLAKQRAEVKHAALLIAAFFAVMFIRELDHWFDFIFHGAWVYPAVLVAGSAIYYACKNGKQTIEQLGLILASPHMNTLVIGLMLLLVFSRLFGMGSFWQGVMGENYVGDVKNIAEEGTELLSYALIALGSIKTVISLTKK
ncbi:hypothetical protein ACFFUS_09250 [Vibrio gallaecicus]|uniref:hypothetical protein n=1 Tax=Vibrio gallaecicus TaxID=552386 RepID=UPI0010C9EDAB|nr:hypothetical protein [Vibrio gallaecicus]MDN3616569.1 hypothetical protein [Vibrio gallaecicus]